MCLSVSLSPLFTAQCQQQGTWLPDSDSADLTASQGSANTNKLYKVFFAAAGDVGWYSLEDKAVVYYSLLYDSTFTLPI